MLESTSSLSPPESSRRTSVLRLSILGYISVPFPLIVTTKKLNTMLADAENIEKKTYVMSSRTPI
jgi:hypothetical protein